MVVFRWGAARCVAGVACCLVLVACGGGDEPGSPGIGDPETTGGAPGNGGGVSADIDESGGSVELPIGGGETRVDIPVGAVDDSVEVRVEPVEADEIAPIEGAADFALEPVAFLPHGTTFDVPVTIAFASPEGFAENAVVARLEDENDTEWELLDSVVDGDEISVQVTSFSIYAVIEGTFCHQDDPDSDGDGVCDSEDECESDSDEDGACDEDDPCPLDPNDDSDNDGVCDSADPCPADPNDDSDNDGVCDSADLCPLDPNDDSDNDGVCDSADPCPADSNDDSDNDGVCDSADPCPADPNDDSDNDGVCDSADPCPADPNDDSDNDGVCDSADPCPADPNDDSDNDGVCDSADSCPLDPNDDSDNDGICDSNDTCPSDPQNDSDGNGVCDGSEARVAGVVTKNGEPVANATVSVYDQLQTLIATVTTGESGDYFLGELAAGTYDIYASQQEECASGYVQVTVATGELANGDIAANCF